MSKFKRVCVVCLTLLVSFCVVMVTFVYFVIAKPELEWHGADFFANDAFVYCTRHGTLPLDVNKFCEEVSEERNSGEKGAVRYRRYIEMHFDVLENSLAQVLDGADYVKPKPGASSNDVYIANVVNNRLRWYLHIWQEERARGMDKRENYRGKRQKIEEGQSEE